jgi:hypothetical protein
VIQRLTRSLFPLWRMACLFYYEAALRQIDPLHDDVPVIVLRINELQRSAA